MKRSPIHPGEFVDLKLSVVEQKLKNAFLSCFVVHQFIQTSKGEKKTHTTNPWPQAFNYGKRRTIERQTPWMSRTKTERKRDEKLYNNTELFFMLSDSFRHGGLFSNECTHICTVYCSSITHLWSRPWRCSAACLVFTRLFSLTYTIMM